MDTRRSIRIVGAVLFLISAGAWGGSLRHWAAYDFPLDRRTFLATRLSISCGAFWYRTTACPRDGLSHGSPSGRLRWIPSCNRNGLGEAELCAPTWPLIGALGTLLVIGAIRARRGTHGCALCGYDTKGLRNGVCPECGSIAVGRPGRPVT